MIAPFDAAAPTYDADFTDQTLGRWLREMVWDYLPFTASDHVLELGCGTGEDAVWLAQRGAQVTATDASPAMLIATADKTAAYSDRVTIKPLDLNHLPTIFEQGFSGVLANFGVLNCAASRPTVATWLYKRLQPGSIAALVVMSPHCPWEMAWFAAHGKFRQAFRRWRDATPAHVGDGVTLPVWYPTPAQLKREFAPYFRHQRTVSIGALLPPSYLAHLVERWPRTFARIHRIEKAIAQFAPFTVLNDHYLILFERKL